ncbi:UDP-N-acetylglucosamine 2-epimerase (hydrolyzing) [bacterium]|nr:UDP-N-acetylglucosamine 2-epimerase (hydrolyzing) [bacterium]|tara:strand:- start:26314 stop:27495 length:1182 start_codon:yes stop_codon:yes gene_type:complete
MKKSKPKKRRRVCFVITSDIHYTRNKLILFELKKRKDIELKIVVGGSALSSRHSSIEGVEEKLKKDGLDIDERVTILVEGGNLIASAKTAGLGVLEFATVFEKIEPDVILLRGDRYEVLSAAIAAVHLNIPIAHIEGGDVSGTVDESIRHAITKLSHIHFTTNDESSERVKRMGENPSYIFNVGSPDVEYVKESAEKFSISNKELLNFGVGGDIDIKKPYILVLYHPVSTEYGKNKEQTEALSEAINNLKVQTLWFWPNTDAGTDEVSGVMRRYHEQVKPEHVRFLRYVAEDKFYALLKNCACLLGNSSSGIKESSYLGVPVVNVGSRQKGRMRGGNVIDVEVHKKEKILSAVKGQIKQGKYKEDELYSKKSTAKNIAKILATSELYTQKSFH